MNAINDNNDPFEDIFRDRFAGFESEPNEILWNKIEPQLPVNPTRWFTYWQISAVILGLFLGGIYFTQKAEPLTDLSSVISIPTSNLLNDKSSKALSKLPMKIHEMNSQTMAGEKSLELSEEKTGPHSQTIEIDVPNGNTSFNKTGKQAIKNIGIIDDQGNENLNQPVNTKMFSQKITEEKPSVFALNNFSENPLNPSNLEQSYQGTTAKSIFEPNNNNLDVLNNASNTFEAKNVSFGRNKIVNDRKNVLSILDAKSYGLLVNHFKMVKLKFVIVPKKEAYFKEKKPLEFYASAMPLLNYYTITPNGNDVNFVHNISVNDDGDRVGFYTQAGLVFTLSDRLKLRTGLTFTKTNHSISYRVRTDSLIVQPADNKGVDISFADLNKTYSQLANYLGTKIEVQYVFLRGEALTHYVSVGGEAAYRLNGSHELNGFANFAYGITRQISDNAFIFVEPTFSYSLNQQSDNSSLLLVKPNKIGFNIGVNFKIK